MSRTALLLALLTACRPATNAAPPADPFAALAGATWIDLSHDFAPDAIYWPTAKAFSLEIVSAERTPAGYYYAANNFSAAEHGGTHLDAPVHFAEGRHTTDQIPLAQLVGRAAVVDVGAKADADRDYRLDVASLEEWESAHGRIGDGSIVLVRTGWSRRWPDKLEYLGTARTGPAAVAELHFPGIDSSAARWLAARKVKAVGIDTPSIDYGQSSTFDTHRILFAADIPAFENLAHLDRLPPSGAFVVALPMKIRGGSGGPLRAVAILPPGNPE
jgi:kynurenine formamidase